MLRQIVAFVVALILGYLPGLIGRMAGQSTWYDELDKPPLQPPGWAFGVVWPVLYLAMGVALFLIWRSTSENKTMAYVLFGIQAVLNAAWSLVFFGMEQAWGGLVVILALVITVAISISHFKRLSVWASWLFVPYLLWILFATYLNLGIIVLN